MKKVISIFIILMCALHMPVNAKQISLNVDMGTPVMLSDTQQTAYIKVSLTGFEQEKNSTRTPANIAIVIDKSGSMDGKKMKQAIEAAVMAVNILDPNDIVSIVTYDTSVEVIVPATKVFDKSSIINAIRRVGAGGSTALFAGVSKGAGEVRKFIEKNRVNRVILLSDGQANIGPSTPTELGQLGMSLGKETISVTTIGLGLGYNEDLMTQLAGYSDGNHAFVENAQDLVKIFQYEFGDVMSVVAQDVNIIINCSPQVKPIRVLGRDAEIIGQKIHTKLNQLYSEQEKYILVEVEVPAAKTGTTYDVASVDVSYENLHSQKRDSLSDSSKVLFSASQDEITKSTNIAVMEKAVEQVSTDNNRQAIILRDKGKIKEAKILLEKNTEYLKDKASSYSSPSIKKLEEESRLDAQELEDEGEWNKKRKSLKARNYKRSKQQSY